MYRKSMREALREAREYRDPVKEDKGFSSQQIKMAYGVLNDPRYKQGNYSGAVRAIEKIAKGLSCLLYTSPSPRDGLLSRMPSSA